MLRRRRIQKEQERMRGGVIQLHTCIRLSKDKLKIVLKKKEAKSPWLFPTVKLRPVLQASPFLASFTARPYLKVSTCFGGCVSQFSVTMKKYQGQSVYKEEISHGSQFSRSLSVMD